MHYCVLKSVFGHVRGKPVPHKALLRVIGIGSAVSWMSSFTIRSAIVDDNQHRIK